MANATPPREGEELDGQVVTQYLQDQGIAVSGTPEILQFSGGASNLTYQLSYDDCQLVLRRPPFGTKAKSAHDMGREHKIMQALAPYFPYCPDMLAFCDDPAIMGSDFYVMQKLDGLIIRQNLPKGMELSEDEQRQLAFALWDGQRQLHQVDYKAAGLADFGKPEGYVSRQVSGWNGRFVKAHTPDVTEAKQVMAWLEANQPPESGQVGIIHNDYKLDNVLVDKDNPMKLVGVLDWEMATLGDPLMDLGCSLAYWVQADDSEELQLIRMMPSTLPGMPSRDEIVQRYCQHTGTSLDNYSFYYIFGLFRLAVIVQQIYYRYYHGQSKNETFAFFGEVANILVRAAEAEIAKS